MKLFKQYEKAKKELWDYFGYTLEWEDYGVDFWSGIYEIKGTELTYGDADYLIVDRYEGKDYTMFKLCEGGCPDRLVIFKKGK